jgi:hypothetical protein
LSIVAPAPTAVDRCRPRATGGGESPSGGDDPTARRSEDDDVLSAGIADPPAVVDADRLVSSIVAGIDAPA